MTQEEAKKVLKELHEDGLFSVRIALETFFPEFKVDYDEMVRKELIEFIDTNTLSIDERHSRWITWLEKQKYTKKDVDDAWLEGIANAKKEFEKQKPQWTEEDIKMINILCSIFEVSDSYYKVDRQGQYAIRAEEILAWLKSLKQRIGE